MEEGSKISLLDLSSQLPFEIDDVVKKEICFGETLIISCGHYEGEIGSEESDDSSCHDASESEVSLEVKHDEMFEFGEIKIKEETVSEEVKEEDDFHFFFFPDCSKPPEPQHSQASLVLVDGLPQANLAAKEQIFCTCKHDKTGDCECVIKYPCKCGAKTKAKCVCYRLKKNCTCPPGQPQEVCTCKGSKSCLCFPGKPKPVCVCKEIEKPCICFERAGELPNPICTCKYKPKFIKDLKPIGEESEQTVEGEEQIDPCTCQEINPKFGCLCKKGKDCTCLEPCVCIEEKSCTCDFVTAQDPIICKSDESKTVCHCELPQDCKCDGSNLDCKCFPHKICTCGNPDDCKCRGVCECRAPCICDTTVSKKPLVCSCLFPSKPDGPELVCTCHDKYEEPKKLKKVKAGTEGYRWCHDVDPRHTYFDYGYDRHNKISFQKQEEEKFKILGLYDEKKEDDVCPVHGINIPPFKKKIRKSSIDCCSSVGGISFSVETLGEDRDKFLVQVVSHSSKEGAKSGTKMVSILDCNLHTMEENRTEQITKKNLTKERKSYIAICESGYYNKVSRTCGEHSVVKRYYHSFKDAKNFLLEGANVVLLRYIGLKRYRGNLKTETVMMNGSICESIYVSHGVSQALVNGKSLFVVKVERHIIEASGYIHQTLTVLTLKGYIVSHEWADSNYMFHINPLLDVVPEKDEIETHAPLREKWREDLQLLSDYLDFKTTRTSEGGRYVTENGALTGTICDYLQALLLIRPHDALHFTRHYFGAALSALDLPHDEYFDPSHQHVRYYFFEE